MERMMPKEAKMNKAEAKEPMSRVKTKVEGGKGSDVGNERKANVRGAQDGGSRAEAGGNPLTHATKELHRQHPHKHDDHGPHHGGKAHERHEPLHGMRPGHK